MVNRQAKCSRCAYSDWKNGDPVEMDRAFRTVNNGGLGECRKNAPCADPCAARRFPIVHPDDWCGDFWPKEPQRD